MTYSLNVIYTDFKSKLNELDAIVNSLSSDPESLARDTHIEGCFIRLTVSWEQFIEEYFLRCMCKAKARSAYIIKPKTSASKNRNEAFIKINKNRKARDKDYTDWLDNKILQQRTNDFFRQNSRVQKVCSSPDKIYELRTIRNAIAHRSPSAIKKFEDHVKNSLGYLASLNPTMASLLIQRNRTTNQLIYTMLSKHFLTLADELTK